MRTICVFTGTRAEYGLLRSLMRAIGDDPELRLQIIASGMHLSPEFGMTVTEIEADGFAIDERVEMLLSGDTPLAVAKSLGVGVLGYAEALHRLRPDVVVVLGDRFEALGLAQAAMLLRVPIAHIHGGEKTEGMIDEAVRHSITKMAHLHFVAADEFRQRVIQLGEEPARVFTVGAPGLDAIEALELLDRHQLEEELGFELRRPTLLVTYHPATLTPTATAPALDALFVALEQLPEARVVFTKSNADAHGRMIDRAVDIYVAEHPEQAIAFRSLGHTRYLSMVRQADAVVGNSSSGLIEAPALHTPTVNMGDRQQGRLRAPSVIDCGETPEEILAAIRKAVSDDFRQLAATSGSPYGDGSAVPRIKDVLATYPLDGILLKRFHDL